MIDNCFLVKLSQKPMQIIPNYTKLFSDDDYRELKTI